jgi:hypothetical protein
VGTLDVLARLVPVGAIAVSARVSVKSLLAVTVVKSSQCEGAVCHLGVWLRARAFGTSECVMLSRMQRLYNVGATPTAPTSM